MEDYPAAREVSHKSKQFSFFERPQEEVSASNRDLRETNTIQPYMRAASSSAVNRFSSQQDPTESQTYLRGSSQAGHLHTSSYYTLGQHPQDTLAGACLEDQALHFKANSSHSTLQRDVAHPNLHYFEQWNHPRDSCQSNFVSETQQRIEELRQQAA